MPGEILKDASGGSRSQPLGEFLFSHLQSLGLRHCFGIPGDYILPLFKALEQTPDMEAVVPTHEPCAAFSADAYGRFTGFSVLLVTYGVGGFNTMNGVAGALSESSPLLVISGGPPTGAPIPETLFTPAPHHFVKHLTSQLEAYGHITDLALRIESPDEAAAMIRRAAGHARKKKLPVYLEIPTNLMQAGIPVDTLDDFSEEEDREAMEQAGSFFLDRIYAAKNPVMIAGAEVGRYGLQQQIRRIMAARNIPVATSILGKGMFNETEPGMLGVYAGIISRTPEIRRIVEQADLVIMVGVKVTDVNCGAFTANLTRDRILVAKSGWVGDGYIRFPENIALDRFVTYLAEKIKRVDHTPEWPEMPERPYGDSNRQMDRYLAIINEHLTEKNVVIADTGDACYGSQFLTIRRDNGYLAPTFYNTMGFAVPAALGVQMADPGSRPVVLVGDGAFQMTGIEFSSLVARKLNPVVILFNNSGYGMQRMFVDGDFNDIHRWDYTRIVDLVGGGKAWQVKAPEEMGETLQAALEFTGGPSLIEAIVEKGDISTGLELLGKSFIREKQGVCPLWKSDAPCEHQNQCAFCRASIWK